MAHKKAVQHNHVEALVVGFNPETLKGWEKLNSDEQTAIKNETLGFEQGIVQLGKANLAVGQHLMNIRTVLEPHRMFVAYLKNFKGFSRATAYRYIGQYQALSEKLPTRVFNIALAKGFNKISPEAVEETPPPATENPERIVEYLESVEQMRKPVPREESYDSERLMKECYNFVHLRFQRLPNVGRTRSAWMRKFAGMLMTELGVSGSQPISPVAIPDNYRTKPGRPKETAAA